MMCGVGTIFLLKNLDVTDLSIGEMFKFLAPVALILFGLNVIFKPSKKESPEWPSIKKARDEERQARREANRLRHSQHKKQWESGNWNTSGDLSGNSKDHMDHTSASNRKHGLTDEEKEVLKDIHGTYPKDEEHGEWTDHQNQHQHKYDGFVRNFDSGNVLHRHGFIGDVHLGQEAWELKPVQISHFIGDSVIDLTRASIPRGKQRFTSLHLLVM